MAEMIERKNPGAYITHKGKKYHRFSGWHTFTGYELERNKSAMDRVSPKGSIMVAWVRKEYKTYYAVFVPIKR